MKPIKTKKQDYIYIEGKNYSQFIYIPKNPAKSSAIKVSHQLTQEQIAYGKLISDSKVIEASNKLIETLKARDENNKTS